MIILIYVIVAGELGRVRKSPPASIEAYFIIAGSDSHVIDTKLGRIGVGICYENLLYDQMCFLHRENVDFVLSLFAAGRPMPFIPGDVKRLEEMLIGGRAIFAKTLGVPVIVANRVGPLETELPGNLPYLKSSFPGLSSIVDSDGTVKAELGDEEGIIVTDICLRQNAVHESEPKRYGNMWGIPVPWYAFVWPLRSVAGCGERHTSMEFREIKSCWNSVQLANSVAKICRRTRQKPVFVLMNVHSVEDTTLGGFPRYGGHPGGGAG